MTMKHSANWQSLLYSQLFISVLCLIKKWSFNFEKVNNNKICIKKIKFFT